MSDNSWYKNAPLVDEKDNSWYKNAPLVDQPAPQPVSKLESALRGFSQGATLGFGDEIQAAIRATPELFSNKTGAFVDQYKQLRDEQRSANENAATVNPISSLAGAAVPMTIQALATGGGSLARQIGTNAALGAAGRIGEADKDNMLSEGVKGGAIAGALTGTLPLLGKAVNKGTDYITRQEVAKNVENIIATKPPGWEKLLENIMGRSKGSFRGEGTTLVKEASNLANAARAGDITTRDFSELSRPAALLSPFSVKESAKNILGAAVEGGKGAVIGSGLNMVAGSPIDPAQAAMAGAGLGGMNAAKKAGSTLTTTLASKYATSPVVGKAGEVLSNTFSNKGVGAATQLGIRELSNKAPFSSITNYLKQAEGATNPAVQQVAQQASQIGNEDPDAKRKAAMELLKTPEGRAVSNTESNVRDLQ